MPNARSPTRPRADAGSAPSGGTGSPSGRELGTPHRLSRARPSARVGRDAVARPGAQRPGGDWRQPGSRPREDQPEQQPPGHAALDAQQGQHHRREHRRGREAGGREPWYCPWRSAGASPIETPHCPAEPSISPTTCRPAARSSSGTATQSGSSAAAAKTTQPIPTNKPALRYARAASGTRSRPRANRTWNSTHADVLTSSSTETNHVGAAVRPATHSGMAISTSPKCIAKTAFRAVAATYGRSLSTRRAGPCGFAGTRPTCGSRPSTAAVIANVTAFSTKTDRYAGRVSTAGARPASSVPTERPTFVTARRYARNRTRSPLSDSVAMRAFRTALLPRSATATRDAITASCQVVRTNR